MDRPRVERFGKLESVDAVPAIERSSVYVAGEPMPKPHWIYADFNGLLERDLLCISHGDTARNHAGEVVPLAAGMKVTAYEDDANEQNRPDAILATGIVEPSPAYAHCRGSKWSVRINADGIRHESESAGEAGDV